jgi:hypothetical protein
MFAWKRMFPLVMTAGFASLGVIVAEDPKPSADPIVTNAPFPQSSQGQPPAQSLPVPMEKSQNKTSDYVKQTIDQLASELKPGEQRLVVNATLLKLPAGFIDECGLFPDMPANGPSIKATTFSQREVSILWALVRAMKPAMTIDVVTRHTLSPLDEGITGFIEVRCNPGAPTESSYTPVEKGAKIKDIASSSVPGYGLRFSPTIDKDTGLIQMEIQTTTVQLGELVQLDKLHSVHSIDSYTSDLAPVAVPSGGTIAVGCRTKPEWLWLLGTHIVRGKK